MTADTRRRIWRFLAIAFLVAGTLGFGLAGLCGAAFTVMSLPDALSSRSGNYAGAALVIAVPSLLLGGALTWCCGRMLWRLTSRDPSKDARNGA